MADDQQIIDLVAMIDQFVANGGGHMNILVENPDDLSELKVDTYKSSDCSMGNSACSIPTLHKGIDDGENGLD